MSYRDSATRLASNADQFKVRQAVYQTATVGWSPSNVSKTIAKAIANVSPNEQKALLENFIETKQHELSTVLIGVSVKSLLGSGAIVAYLRPCLY